MSAKQAIIVWGGWEGHEPDRIADHCGRLLSNEGFEVEVSATLKSFEDVDRLKSYDLIVPIWSMGELEEKQIEGVTKAVAAGVGLGGCHGMCAAFRDCVQWQFLTGGNWVSHPGGDDVEYTVNISNSSSSLVEGIGDFEITSEQYYLLVDPVVEVLATTRFPTVDGYHCSNGVVDMPVAWTKRWGEGRVFYTSLGHRAAVFEIPEANEILRRGLLWAARFSR